MYQLRAVIGALPVLRALTAHHPLVELEQGLHLLPMTEDVAAALTVSSGPPLAPFEHAPPGLGDLLATCSTHGPVAYVEADIFGGTGIQIAQTWHHGHTTLGPIHHDDDEAPPPPITPISQALRELGVLRTTNDEFAAAGLSRHRTTAAWLSSP
ncbi:hypothetical protein [Actinokineospora cianjurensis]|uniref:Uncharacterized protein n=1 Tax=Actinokineospora cianjurensis TaxID=585224 RepID=A0A421AW32_9PSEU|nr:hypothetical protein [Actinokineospora cianjurensis]RLK53822.1 hypothetical protein CLV68_6486 [Actinokineospora cianjurensis]